MEIGRIKIPCKSCKMRYDLAKASRLAENLGTRIVCCPHCGKKVGRQ